MNESLKALEVAQSTNLHLIGNSLTILGWWGRMERIFFGQAVASAEEGLRECQWWLFADAQDSADMVVALDVLKAANELGRAEVLIQQAAGLRGFQIHFAKQPDGQPDFGQPAYKLHIRW